MPFHWPSKRLSVATKFYYNEFRILCRSSTVAQSQLRLRLGDFIGRAIRFYLRRFFNPVPVSLHTYSDAVQPDYSHSRSRIHELIEMAGDDELRDSAIADGSISSVVSLALLRIDEFFDFCETARSLELCDKYPTQFCNRPASKRGLESRGSRVILNDDDLAEILLDITEGHIVLAGVRACKFLHSIMNWPGVKQAIGDIGGWGEVECYAKMFLELKLANELPDEKHFQLLSNVEDLTKTIADDLDDLKSLEEECGKSVRKLWKRFRCGTRNKQLLKINPCIKNVIAEQLKAGRDTYFPSIVSCSDS